MRAPFSAFGHEIDFERRDGGRTDLPLVLCIHGLAGDRAMLVEACDEVLARRGLTRVYVDLPGHGRSTGHTDSASADHLVASLVGLAAALDDRPPLVVAYSYGAYLALGLARDLPLAGLLLACPVVEPEIARRTRPPRRVLERTEGLSFQDDHERETFEEVTVLQTPALLEAYRRVVLPASRAADREFIGAVRARYLMSRPHRDALLGFAQPVHIVCGRHDHWVGFQEAAALAAALPHCALTVAAGAGQLLPLEAPAVLHAALDEWLDRALGGSPASPAPAR